jgi:hypothetical protein
MADLTRNSPKMFDRWFGDDNYCSYYFTVGKKISLKIFVDLLCIIFVISYSGGDAIAI